MTLTKGLHQVGHWIDVSGVGGEIQVVVAARVRQPGGAWQLRVELASCLLSDGSCHVDRFVALPQVVLQLLELVHLGAGRVLDGLERVCRVTLMA